MGHHYVPQRYLKGFQSPERDAWIWMHDKSKDEAKHLPIKQVAQAGEFYDKQTETDLNEEAEKPGNDVIDKIRRGETITPLDRRYLTYYIATMIGRVPIARDRAASFAPQALTDVTAFLKEQLRLTAQTDNWPNELLEQKLAEADVAHDRFQKATPQEVLRIIERPWPFQSWLMAIYNMEWRILRSEGPAFFLTSDNPAMPLSNLGLGNEESELVFPLCKDLCLHCSWQECTAPGIRNLPQDLVEEVNRRIAHGSDRFIFYHENAPWVLTQRYVNPSQLNKIRWAD